MNLCPAGVWFLPPQSLEAAGDARDWFQCWDRSRVLDERAAPALEVFFGSDRPREPVIGFRNS